MSKNLKAIGEVSGAPKPVGPYSTAMISGGFAFLSGQLGLDPATGKLADGVEAQAKQSLANIRAVLTELKLSFNDVVKTTIFLTDLKTFQTVNTLYGEAMGDHRPARSTIQVAALPLGGVVEIEVIAAMPA